MSIWIVTTGNSDIILKHDKNWVSGRNLYGKIRNDLECKKFSQPNQIDKDNIKAGYTSPARVLGLVYGNQPDSYSDLEFPLLDTFSKYFQEKQIRLDKVILLLTDQEKIFQEEQKCYRISPYWQDTLTLEPIFERYFQQKFKLKPIFLKLQPLEGQGLDHWDKTYKLVEATLQGIEYNPLKPVYVSHQAGTPAISSAVQFVSLNKFNKKVKFILSNQYYDIAYNQELKAEEVDYNQQLPSEEIESQEVEYTQLAKPEEVSNDTSEYWRSIQLQKAKQLITSGFPGTALKMVEGIERIKPETLNELKKMVDFFNLHSVDRDNTKDFEVGNASQRIVDSLDLIGFFFNQNNYLQGISLLAAAQETFLKVAILSETAKIPNKYDGVAVSEFLQWDNEGLFLIVENKFALSNVNELNTLKKDILKLLKFPVDNKYFKRYDQGELIFKTNANNVMLAWLNNLKPSLQTWANLKWSCDYYKDRESDLRNQLMHNLRGMEDSDAIGYLLGYPKVKPSIITVMDAYNKNVQKPFLDAIELLKLPCDKGKLQKRLNAIAQSL
jgi:hypothetical protein